MASIKHQFIVECIIRKMRHLGFEPISCDGKCLSASSLKIPPKIYRHRPDLIAIDLTGNLCIGEAKTEGDLTSKRTKEQLKDYYASGVYAVIGCPKSGSHKIMNVVNRLNSDYRKIDLLAIPDELMPDEEV